MRARAAVTGAAVVAWVALAGCGSASPGGDERATATTTTAPASVAIVIARPADGSRLRARETPDGALLVSARLRGSARPGSVVHLSVSCRPRPCSRRVATAADGRWSARMTLTTTRAARFVTIDANARERVAAPGSAVATIELVGARRPRAARGGRAGGAQRSAPAAVAPPPRTLPRAVLVIGDSLAIGMEDPLRAALPGWTVRSDARIGRPLAEGMRILAGERNTPAIVAFSLFTNDDPGATAALAQAVRATAARPGGCAVWSTIVRPPYKGVPYTAANRVLERLAGDPQIALGLQLVDWRAAVAQSPSLIAGDGVHGTPLGYRARGQLYAAAIRVCAGEA